jgi:hypothetical protein
MIDRYAVLPYSSGEYNYCIIDRLDPFGLLISPRRTEREINQVLEKLEKKLDEQPELRATHGAGKAE